MLWWIVPRIAAVLAGFYLSWWSYRLFTNPFIACDTPSRKLVGRLVRDLCESKQADMAGVILALLAVASFLFAFWPRRRGDA